MGKHILAVHSNATEGKDTEYNDWYNNVHLGEVLQVPGFVAAQRFEIADVAPVAGGAPSHQYMAIYELDTDDPQASLDALGASVRDGTMTMSDAINTSDVAACLYGPITDRVTS